MGNTIKMIDLDGNHIEIEKFDKDDFAVYYPDLDSSLRGTKWEVLDDIRETFGHGIHEFIAVAERR